MASTTSLGLQYPDTTDPVGDVRSDLEDLATTADTAIAAVSSTNQAVAYFRGATSTQTIPTGAGTTGVVLNTGGPGAVNEDSGIWSYSSGNTAIVTSEPGLVIVHATVQWDTLTVGEQSDLRIYSRDSGGSANETHWRDQKSVDGPDLAHSMSAMFLLSAGEMLSIQVRHDSGTGEDLAFAQLRAVLIRNDG